MKLFGNRRTGRRAASKSSDAASKRKAAGQDAASQNAKATKGKKPKKEPRFALTKAWRRLPGVARGLILVFAALLLLAGVLFFVYKMVVKPPDLTTTRVLTSSSDEELDETEVFNVPTTVKVVTEIDEDGNEIEVEVEVPASHKEDFYNILIAGTDADGGRTDTIMIARLDAANHTVALLSIPRDTLIATNYSVPKINSAYGAGGMGESGMETLCTQLARLLGFEVDGYVLVDFDAFAEIIELVGDEENGEKGIWFDVPQRMYYVDPSQDLYIDLYAGYQHLNADECEQLVRYRYGYADADIGRISVQQDFVRALANQCLRIGNVTKIQSFAEIFSEYVTTNLTIGNMVYFGVELLECNFDEMETFTLPGEGVELSIGSFYAVYQNQMLELVNEYFNPYDTEITAANVNVASASSYSRPSTSTGGSGNGTGSSTVTEPDPPETEEPTTDPGTGTTDPGTGTTDPDTGTTDPGTGTTDPGTGTTDPGTGTTDPGTGTTDPGTGTTDPGTGTTDPGTGTTDPGTGTTDPGTGTTDPGTGTTDPDTGTGETLPPELEGWG